MLRLFGVGNKQYFSTQLQQQIAFLFVADQFIYLLLIVIGMFEPIYIVSLFQIFFLEIRSQFQVCINVGGTEMRCGVCFGVKAESELRNLALCKG